MFGVAQAGLLFLPFGYMLLVVVVALIIAVVLFKALEKETVSVYTREVPLGGVDAESVMEAARKEMRFRGYKVSVEDGRLVFEDAAFQWVVAPGSVDGEKTVVVEARAKAGFLAATLVLLVLVTIIGVVLAAYAIYKFFQAREAIREALASKIGSRVYRYF